MDESENGERRIAPLSQEETPTKEAEEHVTSMKAQIVFKQVHFAMKIAAIWNMSQSACDVVGGRSSLSSSFEPTERTTKGERRPRERRRPSPMPATLPKEAA